VAELIPYSTGNFLSVRCFYFSSTPVHFFIYSFIYSFIWLNSICLNTGTLFHNFMSLQNYSRRAALPYSRVVSLNVINSS